MAAKEQSPTDSYRFYVHCLSTKKTLKKKKYQSVEEIKQEAFALYEQAKFNDHNAIIIYRDDENQEVVLISVPKPLSKRQYRDLFIKFVCIINSFSVQAQASLFPSRFILPVRCVRVLLAFLTNNFSSNVQLSNVVSSIVRSVSIQFKEFRRSIH